MPSVVKSSIIFLHARIFFTNLELALRDPAHGRFASAGDVHPPGPDLSHPGGLTVGSGQRGIAENLKKDYGSGI